MHAAAPVLEIPGELYEFKFPSVQESWDYFFPSNRDYIQFHRAYDDAYHEAQIVYELDQKSAWKPV